MELFSLNGVKFNSGLVGTGKNYHKASNYERKDWHDWKFIEYETHRKGPGENGTPFVLTDPADIELNEKLFQNRRSLCRR